MATALELTKEWQTLCNLQGFDPSQIICVTPTISDFGGAANTAVFGEYAAPSAATHIEGFTLPFDCLVVAASAKYVHDAAPCAAAANSSLDIDVMVSPSGIESIAANYAKVASALSLTQAELNSKHWNKSATGLSVALEAGQSVAFRSFVNTANIDNLVNADIQLSVWLAVPQSKFVLPTVS
tara:strand:+ start:379 stop:924 length:546 start_codon:yes stop_codon:yes gene_type:complete